MDFPETEWFPAAEKPGEDGLYKRRKVNPAGSDELYGPIMYCLWQDGWWYEGSTELTSALNEPLRKSHYQPGHWENFEWCGVMPGGYERPDVQEVKTSNFVGGFFAPEPVEPIAEESEVEVVQAELALEEPAAINETQQFAAGFFGEQP